LRFRRLETRLFVAFLVLAALPLVLLTLFAGAVVRVGIPRIASPVISQSFENSAVLGREHAARLEFDARRLLANIPVRPPAGAEEERLRERLAEAGFDFVAWELPDGRSKVVEGPGEEAEDDGRPDADDWKALAEGRYPPARRDGTLRIFDPPPGGESTGDGGHDDDVLPAGRRGRALGVRLSPELAYALDTSERFYPSARQLSSRFAGVLRTGLALGLGFTFVGTALAAYLLARRTARRISRPVSELVRSADRLAAGDLAHRADVRADGEVGDLVGAFNRMGARLQRSQERLVRAEREAAWRDVARRVAHEIKNPLTPVRLALHRLRKRVPDDADTRGCLDSIGEEMDNLDRLAGDFSDFAKLPAAEPGETDLARIAAGVVDLFRESAPGVAVLYDGPDSLPLVADRDLLRRAVTNLVKNAVEALSAASGGSVTVSVRVEEDRAELAVTDDGPGIPAEIRESLFSPGVSGRAGGSGLGLSMVRRIAEDHDGALKWEDRGPGTRFALILPLRPPEKP
jgi:nitrogen fixation/metabolism regulation signal transduction histidine kinase